MGTGKTFPGMSEWASQRPPLLVSGVRRAWILVPASSLAGSETELQLPHF